LAVALGLPANSWEGLDGMTTGAYRLPPGRKAAQPHLVMTFGEHKGKYPHELPTHYLDWLCTTRPRQLTNEMLKHIRAARFDRRRQVEAIHAEIAREEATSRRAARIAEAEARQKEAEARAAEAAEAEERLRLQRLREREEQVTPPAPSKTVKPTIDDAMPWEKDCKPPDESRPEE
jgi:ribosomal protein L16 Arg81 hydroxylase